MKILFVFTAARIETNLMFGHYGALIENSQNRNRYDC